MNAGSFKLTLEHKNKYHFCFFFAAMDRRSLVATKKRLRGRSIRFGVRLVGSTSFGWRTSDSGADVHTLRADVERALDLIVVSQVTLSVVLLCATGLFCIAWRTLRVLTLDSVRAAC
jgi:hypothetical protein